jgi:SAM-dependent methyltransferase
VLCLAREFPSARIRGTDPSAERVRAASARVGLDPEGRVVFKQSSRRRLPFPDEFFDLVVIFEGRPAPGEIARVMRSDGHLVLASPTPAHRLGGLRQRLWRRRLPRTPI